PTPPVEPQFGLAISAKAVAGGAATKKRGTILPPLPRHCLLDNTERRIRQRDFMRKLVLCARAGDRPFAAGQVDLAPFDAADFLAATTSQDRQLADATVIVSLASAPAVGELGVRKHAIARRPVRIGIRRDDRIAVECVE